MLPGATTFPQGSARGASWDPSLEERIGDAMGREARVALKDAMALVLARLPPTCLAVTPDRLYSSLW